MRGRQRAGRRRSAPHRRSSRRRPARNCWRLRDETQKHGQALRPPARRRRPEEACKLFKAFLAAEAKMIKGLEQHSATVRRPADVIKQIKAQHAKAQQIGKQVCEAAAQGARPTGPSLSDALGTDPASPRRTATKRGAGTFDTLTGNPLAR